MTNLENLHHHIERLTIKSPEITVLIARHSSAYKKDDRVIVSLLQTLAERDPLFIGLSPSEFCKALDTYKMPLEK